MTYVDGFMAPIAAGKREEFTRFAKEAAKIFKEYGALQVVDCWSNDVPEGGRFKNAGHGHALRRAARDLRRLRGRVVVVKR